MILLSLLRNAGTFSSYFVESAPLFDPEDLSASPIGGGEIFSDLPRDKAQTVSLIFKSCNNTQQIWKSFSVTQRRSARYDTIQL
jgi:hypothetical protein